MNNGQPIPVKEAVEAVQAAIEVCRNVKRGGWELATPVPEYQAFIVAARAGYAATLEYLLQALRHGQWPWPDEAIHPSTRIYAAVAPIVAWRRAQGGRG